MRFLFSVFLISAVALGCDGEHPEPTGNVFPSENNRPNPNNSNNTTGSNNNQTNNTNSNNGNNTSQTNNTTPIGSECDDVECTDPDQRCVRGMCISSSLTVACEQPTELGLLDTTQSFQTMGDTDGFADATKSSCTNMANTFSGAENAFEFSVDAAARVTVNLTSDAAIDWVMSLRVGECLNLEVERLCSDPEELTFLAVPDETYFLIVEPQTGIDEGMFQLDFGFEQTVCAPVGSRTCDGSMIKECVAGGTAETSSQCANGCTDGACNGDSCGAPIEVTASMTFSGDIAGYQSNLNFSGQPTCMGLDTPGQELVLSLPNLTAGQVVRVDAQTNDQNDNAIFVLPSCSDQVECIEALDLGDDLSWTVQNDGSYFIVIDKTTTTPNMFNYSIDIQ